MSDSMRESNGCLSGHGAGHVGASIAVSTELIPRSEPERIAAIRRYDILDTPPDHSFDRLTAIAAKHCDVPISIVTIVDTDRIWFKSRHGLEGVEQVGRDPGLCASAILQDDAWVVENAPEDPRALANPLVAGEFGLRFYAGAPLTTADGHNLGTLCIIDKEPRTFSDEDARVLKDMAAIVVDELELRLAAIRTTAHERMLRMQAEHHAQVLQQSLLPPEPPRLDRVDVAARHLAGGGHDRTRGFVDCFELPAESGYQFAAVVGDVTPASGEASAAASVALARYTIRMAALSAHSPAETLEALNRVMFVGDDDPPPEPRAEPLVVFAREAERRTGPDRVGCRSRSRDHGAPGWHRDDSQLPRATVGMGPGCELRRGIRGAAAAWSTGPSALARSPAQTPRGRRSTSSVGWPIVRHRPAGSCWIGSSEPSSGRP